MIPGEHYSDPNGYAGIAWAISGKHELRQLLKTYAIYMYRWTKRAKLSKATERGRNLSDADSRWVHHQHVRV